MKKFSFLLGILSLPLGVASADDTFQSGSIGLVGPHSIHGTFKHLRNIAQCPSHCYNLHTHIKKHPTKEVREAHISDCTKVCQGVKEIDQGAGQFNPSATRAGR